MNNDVTNRTLIGMWANIAFEWTDISLADDHSDKVLYRYFSFGEYDEDSECDTYGVPDTQMFYYFDQDEVEGLMRAVEAKQDLYRVSDDWYIILCDGIEYEYLEN